jgi:hypothetical protein
LNGLQILKQLWFGWVRFAPPTNQAGRKKAVKQRIKAKGRSKIAVASPRDRGELWSSFG